MSSVEARAPFHYITEAEAAFDRAKELLGVAASHNSGEAGRYEAVNAARDEIALGTLATQIAHVKMVGRGRA